LKEELINKLEIIKKTYDFVLQEIPRRLNYVMKRIKDKHGECLNFDLSSLTRKRKIYIYGDDTAIPYSNGMVLGTKVFYSHLKCLSSTTHEQAHSSFKEVASTYDNVKGLIQHNKELLLEELDNYSLSEEDKFIVSNIIQEISNEFKEHEYYVSYKISKANDEKIEQIAKVADKRKTLIEFYENLRGKKLKRAVEQIFSESDKTKYDNLKRLNELKGKKLRQNILNLIQEIKEDLMKQHDEWYNIDSNFTKKIRKHKFDLGIKSSRINLYFFFLDKRIRVFYDLVKNYDKKDISEEQQKYLYSVAKLEIINQAQEMLIKNDGSPFFSELFPFSLEFLVVNDENDKFNEGAQSFMIDRVRGLPSEITLMFGYNRTGYDYLFANSVLTYLLNKGCSNEEIMVKLLERPLRIKKAIKEIINS
jgi:hypothetical protein